MYLSFLLLQELPGLAGLEKLTLVGALAVGLWALWRKLGEKDKQLDRAIEVGHEQAKATENVADALERLRDKIEK